MILTRIGFAASLAVSAAIHAYLYIHGYQHIPSIGTGFLVQASVSFALAALILVGGPGWLLWAAAGLAGGSLVAFVLSRTTGFAGFSEHGWDPSPYAVISVAAEALTVLLWAAAVAPRSRLRRVAGPAAESRRASHV
ncbi:hypothetical protein [Mycobacterium sp.]|uniref:hypothetical protein n=1 Tax=Mycobacterium sp. TaxID=1785 RepID=UPI0025CE581C|nr:hypothetical protein [Mycobacterium sp.]